MFDVFAAFSGHLFLIVRVRRNLLVGFLELATTIVMVKGGGELSFYLPGEILCRDPAIKAKIWILNSGSNRPKKEAQMPRGVFFYSLVPDVAVPLLFFLCSFSPWSPSYQLPDSATLIPYNPGLNPSRSLRLRRLVLLPSPPRFGLSEMSE